MCTKSSWTNTGLKALKVQCGGGGGVCRDTIYYQHRCCRVLKLKYVISLCMWGKKTFNHLI